MDVVAKVHAMPQLTYSLRTANFVEPLCSSGMTESGVLTLVSEQFGLMAGVPSDKLVDGGGDLLTFKCQ